MEGSSWPGYIRDFDRLLPEFGGVLQRAMHFLEPDTLARELAAAGFRVLTCRFFRAPSTPEVCRLDGRECVGAIAEAA